MLALALGGADPQVVDAMLRKRGDYRPHARFGVDLAVRARLGESPRVLSAPPLTLAPRQVPWTAGGREQACWDMAGAAHSTTRALEGGGGGRGPADELTLALRELSFEEAESSVAPERVVGGSAERPWERVGAEPGAWGSSAGGAAKQQPQLQPPLRPDLQPGEAASARAADTLNDWGLAAFAAGAAGAAATAFTEAARLHPTAAAYPANLAAALLRCGDARRAADAARACLRLQPLHGRALVRLGSASLKIAESPYVGDRGRAELREARGAFAEAVRVCPESGEARRGLREAELAWAAEFDSDEE